MGRPAWWSSKLRNGAARVKNKIRTSKRQHSRAQPVTSIANTSHDLSHEFGIVFRRARLRTCDGHNRKPREEWQWIDAV
jgi:hypothetical protein